MVSCTASKQILRAPEQDRGTCGGSLRRAPRDVKAARPTAAQQRRGGATSGTGFPAQAVALRQQLRNVLWATSKHDVYAMHNYSVMHWSSSLQRIKEVLNVAGQLAPTQLDSECCHPVISFLLKRIGYHCRQAEEEWACIIELDTGGTEKFCLKPIKVKFWFRTGAHRQRWNMLKRNMTDEFSLQQIMEYYVQPISKKRSWSMTRLIAELHS